MLTSCTVDQLSPALLWAEGLDQRVAAYPCYQLALASFACWVLPGLLNTFERCTLWNANSLLAHMWQFATFYLQSLLACVHFGGTALHQTIDSSLLQYSMQSWTSICVDARELHLLSTILHSPCRPPDMPLQASCVISACCCITQLACPCMAQRQCHQTGSKFSNAPCMGSRCQARAASCAWGMFGLHELERPFTDGGHQGEGRHACALLLSAFLPSSMLCPASLLIPWHLALVLCSSLSPLQICAQ